MSPLHIEDFAEYWEHKGQVDMSSDSIEPPHTLETFHSPSLEREVRLKEALGPSTNVDTKEPVGMNIAQAEAVIRGLQDVLYTPGREE